MLNRIPGSQDKSFMIFWPKLALGTVINSQGITLLPRLTTVLPSDFTFLCLTSFFSKRGNNN